jgi:hypothetical protein
VLGRDAVIVRPAAVPLIIVCPTANILWAVDIAVAINVVVPFVYPVKDAESASDFIIAFATGAVGEGGADPV